MRVRSNTRAFRTLAVACLVLLSCTGEHPAPGALSHATPLAERQRGVSWVAGRDTVLASDFHSLADRGVNWIVQTPFGWQSDPGVPEVRGIRGNRGWWGERDEGIERTAEHARAAGLSTLLKPHIWLSDRNDDTWRGDIAMETEEDWAAWFREYGEWILHYAELAERLGIEALCIGTELGGTVHRESEWRALIADIRTVYRGPLTYAANWDREYAEVKFWDALDWIGVQAYFPLSDAEFPSTEQMSRGWQDPVERLGELAAAQGKPIVFTELGYKSVPFTADEPWLWPERRAEVTDPRAFEAQARAYDAFFSTVWPMEWVAGVYFWKWYPSTTLERASLSADFTPQNKPAEQVLVRWYRSSAGGTE